MTIVAGDGMHSTATVHGACFSMEYKYRLISMISMISTDEKYHGHLGARLMNYGTIWLVVDRF